MIYTKIKKMYLLLFFLVITYCIVNWLIFSQFFNSIVEIQPLYFSINYLYQSFKISIVIIIAISTIVTNYAYQYLIKYQLYFEIGKNQNFFKKLFKFKVIYSFYTTLTVLCGLYLIAVIFFVINPSSTFLVGDKSIYLHQGINDSGMEYLLTTNPIYNFLFETIVGFALPTFFFSFLFLYVYDVMRKPIAVYFFILVLLLVVPFLLNLVIPSNYNFATAFNLEMFIDFKVYKIILPYLALIIVVLILGVKNNDI